MMVSLRQYRRHSVPIQYVSTLKNHEGGHPTGDHFTTKNPILSGESHDFSERTAVRSKYPPAKPEALVREPLKAA